jgi:copper(I)-binding protein
MMPSHPGATKSYPRVFAFVGGWLLVSTAAWAGVTTTDAWVRGTVPSQDTTGAFLTITSSESAKLVGVATPIAKTAEIHQTMNHGGMMHMDGVKAVELPAGKPVPLQPGGYHVMLMGLKAPVKADSKVPLTLTIEDARGKRSTVRVEASVRPLGQ